jgi:hypothetical protein
MSTDVIYLAALFLINVSNVVVFWFSYCFEGIHREVALQCPLLVKAISVATVAALTSLGNTPPPSSSSS